MNAADAPSPPGAADRGLGTITRAGIGIAALGAALSAVAPLAGDLLRGEGRESGMPLTAGIGPTVGTVSALVAALLVAAVLVPRSWAQLGGIVLGTIAAYASAGQVVAARTSRDFAPEPGFTILDGGVLLLAGAVLALVGALTALAGVRRSPRPDPSTPVRTLGGGSGRPPTSARAVLAPILAVVGVLFGALPPLAVAVGTLALLDLRERPTLGGRGLATTGVALGILVLSLYVAGLGAAAFTATPPD